MQFPLCFTACLGAGKISKGTFQVSSALTYNRALLPAELTEQVVFSCGDALSLPGTHCREGLSKVLCVILCLIKMSTVLKKKKRNVIQSACFCVKKLVGGVALLKSVCRCYLEIGSYVSRAGVKLTV